MNEQIYLTAEGADRLKAELEELVGPARTEIAKRLRAAIQQGDLSENADYHKAKEDQGFLEGRIQELEFLLKNAAIIPTNNGNKDTIDIGARITVQEEDFEPETYHLVGPTEADPRNGRISYVSPIGQALLGRRVGEKINVQTPGGNITLSIVKIE